MFVYIGTIYSGNLNDDVPAFKEDPLRKHFSFCSLEIKVTITFLMFEINLEGCL